MTVTRQDLRDAISDEIGSWRPADDIGRAVTAVPHLFAPERAELARLQALLEAVTIEATECHFLPHLNGCDPDGTEGPDEYVGLHREASNVADSLHRIGYAVNPEAFSEPAHPLTVPWTPRPKDPS